MSRQPRPYRLIHGICYTRLIPGRNPTTRVSMDPHAGGGGQDFYHDPAIRLSEEDIANFKGLRGRPLCVEHNRNHVVGEIAEAWPDGDGVLRITARLFDEDMYQRVKSGAMAGFSVGYECKLKNGKSKEVDYKIFHEVSICEEGYFPGTRVTVAASSSSEKEKKQQLYFTIMASEGGQQAAPPVATPPPPTPVPPNKDAEALLEAHDQVLTNREELLKTVEQQKERIAQLEADHQARLELERKAVEEYKQSQEENKKTLMELETERYRVATGDPNAELPDGLKNGYSRMWDHPATQKEAMAVMASAKAWKLQQEQLQAKEKLLEEKNRELEEREKLGVNLAAKINASNKRVAAFEEREEKKVGGEDQTAAVINAHYKPGDVGGMFAPSEEEKQLRAMQLGLQYMNPNSAEYLSITAHSQTPKVDLVPDPFWPHLRNEAPDALRKKYPQMGSFLLQNNYKGVSTAGASGQCKMEYTLFVDGKPINNDTVRRN